MKERTGTQGKGGTRRKDRALYGKIGKRKPKGESSSMPDRRKGRRGVGTETKKSG